MMVTTRAQSKGETHSEPPRVEVDSPFALHYIDEGAAHIVYDITPQRALEFEDGDFEGSTSTERSQTGTRLDRRFKAKLLRLRKDVPSAVSVRESHKFFIDNIQPLFPKDSLLEQGLCGVSSDILRKLNECLRRDEKKEFPRDQARHGIYLAEDEPHGLLITNMLCNDEYKSCDFKPKWLLQSPSAPPAARRCRTCALRASRNPEPNHSTESSAFCPLVLTKGDEELLSDHLEGALEKMRGAPLYTPDEVRQVVPYLMRSPILHRLRELQEHFDQEGPLQAQMGSERFRTAMTLRDCTVFIKIPYDNNEDVELRLGDFDLKSSGAGKADYWRNTERKLVEEGWYTATEKLSRGSKEAGFLDSLCLRMQLPLSTMQKRISAQMVSNFEDAPLNSST
ncbi:hypothetical protein G7Y79_00075g099010 [Physcia stellaris]|nr:hypothetical protein G7Y79_00075g099010 [Physcia stellaris]